MGVADAKRQLRAEITKIDARIEDLLSRAEKLEKEKEPFEKALDALDRSNGRRKRTQQSEWDVRVLDFLRQHPDRVFTAREVTDLMPGDPAPGSVTRTLHSLWKRHRVTLVTPPGQKKFRKYQHKPVTIKPGEGVTP